MKITSDNKQNIIDNLPYHNGEFADYYAQIEADIIDYFEFEETEFDKAEELESYYDDFFINDGITGNASGSYFCNSNKAEQMVNKVIWTEELLDYFREFGYDHVPFEKGAEHIDVSIRCFMLSECLQEVIQAINDTIAEEEENNN